MADACAARSVDFVDAPVSGGVEGAANGTLTSFCGGTSEAVARARPVLEHLGRRIEHLGPNGAGQVTKAVNQVVLAGTYLGVAEGIAMAEAAGLDPATVVAAIEQGAAASWVLSNRATEHGQPGLPVGRSAGAAPEGSRHRAGPRSAMTGQLLPVATLVAGIEQMLAAAGYGDEDVSCVIRYLRPRRRGPEPRALTRAMERTALMGAIDYWCNTFTAEGLDRHWRQQPEIMEVVSWWGMEPRLVARTVPEFLAFMDEGDVDAVMIPSAKMASYTTQRLIWDVSEDEVLDIANAGARAHLRAVRDRSPGGDGRRAAASRPRSGMASGVFVGAHLHPYGFGLEINHRRYYPFYAKCSSWASPS